MWCHCSNRYSRVVLRSLVQGRPGKMNTRSAGLTKPYTIDRHGGSSAALPAAVSLQSGVILHLPAPGCCTKITIIMGALKPHRVSKVKKILRNQAARLGASRATAQVRSETTADRDRHSNAFVATVRSHPTESCTTRRQHMRLIILEFGSRSQEVPAILLVQLHR